VISALQKVDLLMLDDVDEPVLLGDPPRPWPSGKVLQRLRLAQASERSPQDVLDEDQHAEGRATVSIDPEAKVFPKLWMKDGYVLARPPRGLRPF
jgi:hypothetical protein